MIDTLTQYDFLYDVDWETFPLAGDEIYVAIVTVGPTNLVSELDPEGDSMEVVSHPRDADGDADVDLADFLAFQLCFNGPNRPPACG